MTGPITALMLYNEFCWDGKPSKKNQFGRVITRKEWDTYRLVALVLAQILTPIIMIITPNSVNLTQDQIDPELYTLEMLKPFDKNYGD